MNSRPGRAPPDRGALDRGVLGRGVLGRGVLGRGVLRRNTRLGFTLLEVLVAIAILGLGLTIVLSAQTGVFWSYSRARHLSQAPGLVRCKMAEIELELLKFGFSLTEETDDGECCEDQAAPGYTCEWKVQKVVLPELPMADAMGGDAGAGAGLGALGSLASLQAGGGAALGDDPKVADFTELMGQNASMSGIAPMVMGLVYPDLKPMLEASIRKVIVTVRWKEGETDRDLSVTQYVTSPQTFDPLAASGLDEASDQLINQISGATGQGAGEATPTPQKKAAP